MQGDVSFTFLDRIEEVELNIVDRRWQSALALALTLPDICGGIAFPEIVKHYRDGRVMLDRKKNPTRDVGTQYIRWFDEYAGDYFKLSQFDEKPYICGERCWQLRCEYLHQNKGFLNDENNIRFHLGLNCGMSVCQLDSMNIQENGNDIRIDIEQFCLRMCKAAKSYYDKVHLEKDFSLYNTPVLDFIQVTQKKKAASIIALVCGSERYAKGLKELQAQHDRLQKERDQLQERMNHLEEQREHLQMQTDQAFRSADEIEKICDEIWHHANTIHLYSSLAEEESKSITMKEKQKEIIRTTEEILNIIYKYKGNV